MQYTAEEVELWERRQDEKRQRKDGVFADWAEANLRKQQKLFDRIHPDLDKYQAQKEESTFQKEASLLDYAANPVDYTPSSEAVNHMVKDLEKQYVFYGRVLLACLIMLLRFPPSYPSRAEVRSKHTRVRVEKDSDDVSYINEKNKKFNEKVSRYDGMIRCVDLILDRVYGKYTEEIKESLERGTAI